MEIRIYIETSGELYDRDIYVSYTAEAAPHPGDSFFMDDTLLDGLELSILQRGHLEDYSHLIYGVHSQLYPPYFSLEDVDTVKRVFWHLSSDKCVLCNVVLGTERVRDEDSLLSIEACEEVRLRQLSELAESK